MSDNNIKGIRITESATSSSTKNEHIPKEYRRIIVKMDSGKAKRWIIFTYENLKGETKEHKIQSKFVTGTKEGVAIYFVGKANIFDGETLHFFLEKMTKVIDGKKKYKNGLEWVKAELCDAGFEQENPVSVAA